VSASIRCFARKRGVGVWWGAAHGSDVLKQGKGDDSRKEKKPNWEQCRMDRPKTRGDKEGDKDVRSQRGKRRKKRRKKIVGQKGKQGYEWKSGAEQKARRRQGERKSHAC